MPLSSASRVGPVEETDGVVGRLAAVWTLEAFVDLEGVRFRKPPVRDVLRRRLKSSDAVSV